MTAHPSSPDPPEEEPASRGRPATLALPVFNERKRIHDTLVRLGEQAVDMMRRYDWEILVVDDGSRDDSIDEIVRVATDVRLPLRLLAHDVNRGLGSALSTIFRESRGDLVVTVDADLTYSADHVSQLVRAWEATQAAVVVASPYAVGGSTRAVPWGLETRSRLANRYLAAMTGADVATFTGIVRAYDGEFVRSLPPLRGGSFANVEVLYEAWRRRHDVVEIPAHLDWSGQLDRRRRHNMLSQGALAEVAQVVVAGVRLRTVARRMRRATVPPHAHVTRTAPTDGPRRPESRTA